MPWLPVQLFNALQKGVVGQEPALKEVAVALCKHLNGTGSGNLLFIGSSGTGKTTLMRHIEKVLGKATSSNAPLVVRLNAAVLADEEASRTESHVVLRALLEAAQGLLGARATRAELVAAVERGIVFIDEVDKIRAEIGGRPSASGIRAQEALLTLMEADRVLFTVTGADGTAETVIRSQNILFIAAGAFEGLHDIVYHRVTVGADAGSLKKENIMTPWGQIVEREAFTLSELWKTEDLFAYGISPQFFGRFEGVVFLADLQAEALGRILIDMPDSVFQVSREYFRTYGVDLQITPRALEILCARAMEQPRLGARALRSLFKEVIAPYEYEPDKLPELRPVPTEGALPIFVLDESRVLKGLRLQPAAG
jgi:ATP-dependent Clp protease ATP-binding subunit ClpX